MLITILGMGVWCTQNAPRRQQFHVAPAMEQSGRSVSTPLWWLFKSCCKWHAVTQFRITCDRSAVSLLERIALYKNGQQRQQQ